MDIRKEFGKRVRELRKRASLTQAQLAARCGRNVEMQRVGEIERGERNCTLQTVQQLARALNCEPAALFLFRPQQVGSMLTLLDARLADAWKTADSAQKQKIIRILAELL